MTSSQLNILTLPEMLKMLQMEYAIHLKNLLNLQLLKYYVCQKKVAPHYKKSIVKLILILNF